MLIFFPIDFDFEEYDGLFARYICHEEKVYLANDRHKFIQAHRNGQMVFWKYALYKTHSCPVRAITEIGDYGVHTVKFESIKHTHPPTVHNVPQSFWVSISSSQQNSENSPNGNKDSFRHLPRKKNNSGMNASYESLGAKQYDECVSIALYTDK